jgi:hypothetical protein
VMSWELTKGRVPKRQRKRFEMFEIKTMAPLSPLLTVPAEANN